jgi:hypothetical protein
MGSIPLAVFYVMQERKMIFLSVLFIFEGLPSSFFMGIFTREIADVLGEDVHRLVHVCTCITVGGKGLPQRQAG